MRWLCGLMMFVAASLFTEAALAYGVVGDFGFLFEPLIIQDPSPANKLDTLGSSWAKSSDANTYRISSSSKKVLYIDEDHLPRFSIGSGTLWSHASTLEDPSRDGWDNLDMFAKLPSYYSLEHEFLISFALQVQLPADNHAVAERNQTSLGPTFLSERGMGDLPHWRELIADNESPTDESGQAPNPIVQLEFGGWSLPVLLSRAAVSR